MSSPVPVKVVAMIGTAAPSGGANIGEPRSNPRAGNELTRDIAQAPIAKMTVFHLPLVYRDKMPIISGAAIDSRTLVGECNEDKTQRPA